MTVLERSRTERLGGTGLRLWGGRNETVARRDGSGLQVPTIASIASASVPGPEGWTTVRRRLFDAAAEELGITILHRTEVVNVGQDADSAWQRTRWARSTRPTSSFGRTVTRAWLRRSVDPSHPDATYAGYTIWTVNVSYHAVAGDRAPAVLRAYEKQRLRTAQRMVRSGQGFGHDLMDTGAN